jgi:WASH complex subunit 7
MLLLNFTLSVVQFEGLLKDIQVDELKYQLWKLELLATHQSVVERNTDCSFVYWISNLIPAMMQDVFNLQADQNQAQRLQYLFLAFNDCATTLFSVGGQHSQAAAAAGGAGASTDSILVAGALRQQALALEYRTEVLNHFTTHIVNPLSREVETDLRLHTHSVVLQQANLRTGGAGAGARIKDLSKFLNLPPLRFFDTLIDVRARVTHYLDSIFYNLNTVALHDWRIYAEMRNLAHEKYGLDMTEVHLPGSCHFSEALDILEIMRNIHIFVSRYNYNMNTQIFIERAFDQKVRRFFAQAPSATQPSDITQGGMHTLHYAGETSSPSPLNFSTTCACWHLAHICRIFPSCCLCVCACVASFST